MRSPLSELFIVSDMGASQEDDVLNILRDIATHTFTIPGEAVSTIHKGVTANEFALAFGVGNDAEQIAEIDALGISLICMKALLRRIEALESV